MRRGQGTTSIAFAILALAFAGPGPAWADGSDITASDLAGGASRPCPKRDLEAVLGPCVVVTRDDPVDVYVLTMLGRLHFGRCAVQYSLHVDADGRTEMYHVTFDGPQPCPDALACGWEEERARPWPGRIHGDGRGGFHNHVDVCLDTCLGQFQGRLTIDLLRHRQGWRARAQQQSVGTSGLSFDGPWSFYFGENLGLRLRDVP